MSTDSERSPERGSPEASVTTVLIDLDGPLTRLLPAPAHIALADRLTGMFRQELNGAAAPFLDAMGTSVATDHVQVLRHASTVAPALLERLEAAATGAEVEAAERAILATGAAQFIATARGAGCSVAVVSNNAKAAVERLLSRTGLRPWIDHVAARGGTGVGRLKPAPDLLLEAMAVLGADPQSCIFLGDTVSDVQAGLRAGVPVIGVSSDPERAQELLAAGAERVVDDLAAALDLFPDTGRTAQVERVVETVLPTRHGSFRMTGFAGPDGTEHVALSIGVSDDVPATAPPLVRIHSECLTGDALGSRRCDCGTQLDAALARIAAEGAGVVVYVRGHEGRGIGLLEKLKAYRLQDQGFDTVDANLALGHPRDARTYDQAAGILKDLGLTQIRLMSSNPAKETALRALGIEIAERTGMFVPEHPENHHYLSTKRQRMGHDAPDGGTWTELLSGSLPISAATAQDRELIERYGPLVTAGSRLVVAQMAQSLDGFIATGCGDGAALSGPQDHAHLHRLRALMDAVVVGAGTVVADDPRLTVREVLGRNPVRVVIDPNARIPTSARVLQDGGSTIWLVRPGASVPAVEGVVHDAVEVVRLEQSGFEPKQIIDLLAARGLGRVFVEGGGRTVSRFLEEGCLDRLFVTTVPVLLGDGVPGVRARPAALVRDADRPRSRTFMLGQDVCTELTFAGEAHQQTRTDLASRDAGPSPTLQGRSARSA